MPPGDRDLRRLSIKARDQIELDACRLGFCSPAVQSRNVTTMQGPVPAKEGLRPGSSLVSEQPAIVS
jgi:hypothetical protein